jgi:hypothetical protein
MAEIIETVKTASLALVLAWLAVMGLWSITR